MDALWTYGPNVVSIVGALLSAGGTFWKSFREADSKDGRSPKPTRIPAVVIVVGALLVIGGSFWTFQSQLRSAKVQSELQGRLLLKSDEEIALSKQLTAKTEEIAELNKALSRKSDEALTGLEHAVTEITGGDGFPVVYPWPFPPLIEKYGGIPLAITAERATLTGVKCIVHEEGDPPRNYSGQLPVGTVRANPEDSVEFLPNYVLHPAETGTTRYGIVCSARNGDTEQVLEMRFNPSKRRWEDRITVTRGWPANRKVLLNTSWPQE